MSFPIVLSGNLGDQEILYRHLSDEVRAMMSGAPLHVFEAENKGIVATVPGMPVARHSSGSGIVPALATGSSTAAIGLTVVGSAASLISTIQTIGRLTLTDWTATTGTATLAPLATYYLSQTSGRLTTTPPTTGGTITQRVGTALSTQMLEICVDAPIRN